MTTWRKPSEPIDWQAVRAHLDQSAQALADLRKAVQLNPRNLRPLYRLAEETERQGDENGAAEVQQLLQKILDAQPDNLAALLELSRIAAKRSDAATLKSAVERIGARIADDFTLIGEKFFDFLFQLINNKV